MPGEIWRAVSLAHGAPEALSLRKLRPSNRLDTICPCQGWLHHRVSVHTPCCRSVRRLSGVVSLGVDVARRLRGRHGRDSNVRT
jgi:hypothetical protein